MIGSRKKRASKPDQPSGQDQVTDVTGDASISILEYAINPVYKKDAESLGAKSISDLKATFDSMAAKGYKSLFEVLWYRQIPCFDVKDTTSSSDNQHGMIKNCEWKGHKIPCSAIFQTTPSDRGMCCTFNIEEAEKMFKDEEYRVGTLH